MIIGLLLDVLRRRPLISFILSLLTGFSSTVPTQPQTVQNKEVWEIVRTPEGRIQNVVIHRRLVYGAENNTVDESPGNRLIELD